jgi:hypothetical protein
MKKVLNRLWKFFNDYAAWIVYGILLGLILTSIFGCSRQRVIKIPPPIYPVMERVIIEKDGSLDPPNVEMTVINMLKLQELIDILYEAPCYTK